MVRRVAPDLLAVAIQQRTLVRERFHRAADEVPDVGVARHHPQRQLLATAADDERRIRLLDRLRLAARLFNW